MMIQFRYEELNIKNWDGDRDEVIVLKYLQKQGYNVVKIRKKKEEFQKLRDIISKLMRGFSYNIPIDIDNLENDILALIYAHNGVPDLFYYKDYNDFGFVEVKFQYDTLQRNQLIWISKFNKIVSKYTTYLNPKILPLITVYCVFPYN